jgi:hypothetical protein
VFIPCLPNTLQIVDNNFADAVQFLRGEAVIVAQDDGFQPEFADGAIPTHVDMLRLITVETVKEQPIRTRNSRDGRQGERLQLLARTSGSLYHPSAFKRFKISRTFMPDILLRDSTSAKRKETKTSGRTKTLRLDSRPPSQTMEGMDRRENNTASEVEADLQAVIDHLITGRPLDAGTARRVRERSEQATQATLEKQGVLNAAVDLVREIRDEE